VLLDEKLRAMDARPETILGYTGKCYTGAEAARRVSLGMADVTIGTQTDAVGIDNVDFVPLQASWIDLVVRKTPETRPVIRRLKTLLAEGSIAAELTALPGVDDSRLGVIVYES